MKHLIATGAVHSSLNGPTREGSSRLHQRARHITHVAILVSALIGTAAPLEAGDKAGKITYQDLVPGGMAMGGVTSSIGGPTSERESREVMARMFENHFLITRTDIPFMGSDRVRAAVGLDSYEAMLDHVQLTGEVTAPALASLRAALVDSVRYVVVARLEREKVKRYKNEEDPDDDPQTENSEIVKTAYRILEVGFRVYDLRDGPLAWNTRQSGTESKETSMPADPKLFKSYTVAGILESALTDDMGPPDPQLQDTFANLPRIFDKFVSKLPKKKK